VRKDVEVSAIMRVQSETCTSLAVGDVNDRDIINRHLEVNNTFIGTIVWKSKAERFYMLLLVLRL
jgi:hypothetical protein